MSVKICKFIPPKKYVHVISVNLKYNNIIEMKIAKRDDDVNVSLRYEKYFNNRIIDNKYEILRHPKQNIKLLLQITHHIFTSSPNAFYQAY